MAQAFKQKNALASFLSKFSTSNKMPNGIHFLLVWDDFYTDGSSANENFEIKTSDRNDLSVYENAYVYDCTFQGISKILCLILLSDKKYVILSAFVLDFFSENK